MSLLCAVSGADGYVGAHLERYLRAQGRDILRLVRRTRDERDVRFHLGDELDPERLRGVDTLFHCAYDFQALGWDEILRINVHGSEKLLRSARAAGVRRIVFISTVSAFAGCSSFYGRGKMMVEDAVLASGGAVIRPGLIYGSPGKGMFGALSRLAKLPLLPLFNGGDQPLVLVHIDDLVRAVASAVLWESSDLAMPVTAAHPRHTSLRDILELIAAKQGRSLRAVSIPGWAGLGLLRTLEALGMSLRFRSDSLVSLLNPNPRLDFSEAQRLRLVFRDFREAAAECL